MAQPTTEALVEGAGAARGRSAGGARKGAGAPRRGHSSEGLPIGRGSALTSEILKYGTGSHRLLF
jgi:hypothetical protein